MTSHEPVSVPRHSDLSVELVQALWRKDMLARVMFTGFLAALVTIFVQTATYEAERRERYGTLTTAVLVGSSATFTLEPARISAAITNAETIDSMPTCNHTSEGDVVELIGYAQRFWVCGRFDPDEHVYSWRPTGNR